MNFFCIFEDDLKHTFRLNFTLQGGSKLKKISTFFYKSHKKSQNHKICKHNQSYVIKFINVIKFIQIIRPIKFNKVIKS
jgi:hypothetical protein